LSGKEPLEFPFMKINKPINQKVAIAYPAFRASSQRFALKAKDSFNDPVIKRIMDLFFAGVMIVLAFPVSMAIVLAIKIEDGGPVFYRQERWGRKGRKFQALKFRTMVPHSDQLYGIRPAEENDHRITRVGRLLRNMGLDELPQIIHIITGEMSFVGPRPERPFFVEKLKNEIPFYSYRHSVKPGITGWAQIRYPYGASKEDALEKLKYDIFYIKHMSPLLDLMIISDTIKIMLMGKGAR